MARQRDLDRLLSDLRSFLLILDRESLSSVARAKKKSVADLLSRLQTPLSEDAEYMIMRCLSPTPGTPQGRGGSGARTRDGLGGRGCDRRSASTLSLRGGSKMLGISASSPADASYEDAEPLSPIRCSAEHPDAPPPRHPAAPSSTPVPSRLSGDADSDSSHYESYGEDEEAVTDRAHYLSRDAELAGRPQAQLCGFLWRRRWLGQWAKQLFIIRQHVLLCFRCATDPHPVLELDLRGCHITSKAKRGKKMPHTLKVTGTAGETLVIGFQSRQQAEDWRKVMEEVSSDTPSGLAAASALASPSSRIGRAHFGDEEDEECSWQSPTRSPRPTEDAKGGFLAVRLRGRWQRLWCGVRDGALRLFPAPSGTQRHPVCALRLDGCQVPPGGASGSPPQQQLRIRMAQRGRALALRQQTHSDTERGAWLKPLPARGGESPRTEPPRLGDEGGLLLRRVPTPNAYMDDPFGQLPSAETPRAPSSSTERLLQLQQSLDRAVQRQRRRPLSAVPTSATSSVLGSSWSSQAAFRDRAASPGLRSRNLSGSHRTLTLPEQEGARDELDILTGRRAFPKLEEKLGQLERASRMKGRKAGSEMNLLAINRLPKGHGAAPTSSAGSELCSVLPPLLQRTASARSPPRAPPSPVMVVEKGNVLQKTKEWEMKSAL